MYLTDVLEFESEFFFQHCINRVLSGEVGVVAMVLGTIVGSTVGAVFGLVGTVG